MSYIPKEGLENLKNYKYVSGGYSTVDNLMNPFWESIVRIYPLWLAPNLITSIGFIIFLLSTLSFSLYDLSFSNTDIPSYIFLCNAGAIFIYQTMDATDGKQARKTKTSSPLGQLVDHGLDSFSVTFLFITFFFAFSIDHFWIKYIISLSLFSSYVANWSEKHLGKLLTNFGDFGVTESQFIFISINLITYFYGQSVWHTNHVYDLLPTLIQHYLPSWILNQEAHMTLVAFALFIQPFIGSIVTLKAFHAANSKLQALLELIPMLTIVYCFNCWIDQAANHDHLFLVVLNFGVLNAVYCCKLIISTTTKVHYHYFNLDLLFHLIMTQVIKTYSIHSFNISCLYLSYSVIKSIRYMYLIQKQITQYLGIYIFSLQKKKQKHS